MRLVAEHLGRAYDTRHVVDDVNLTVGLGDSVSVMGPSGSGKTTLLALLGGLVAPTSGFAGIVHDDGSRASSMGKVAFILQTVNTFPRRSVLDNVALGALGDGVSWARALELAHEQLPRVGLSRLEHQPIRSLSGGELQRAVLARALVGNHPFVLADEPTGQLDRSTTRAVMETMLSATTQKGLLLVTHDEDVATMCDRSLILNDGRLE